MKYGMLIIGLLLIVGLIAGCSGKRSIIDDTTDTPDTPSTPPSSSTDSDVDSELDDTYVEDEELDVGSLY